MLWCSSLTIAAKICIWNIYLLFTKSAEWAKSDPPPPTVAMCAILADQVLTQRKKSRPMSYFDLLLILPPINKIWFPKRINGLDTTEVQRHPQEDDPKTCSKGRFKQRASLKNVCIGPSFLEQASSGKLSKPLTKGIVLDSTLCNRVAKEYNTDHGQIPETIKWYSGSFFLQPAGRLQHRLWYRLNFFAYLRVLIQVWSTTINSRAAPLRLGLECGRIVRVHSSALLHSIYHLDHGDTFLSYDHHLWTSKNSWYSLVVGWLFLQDSSWNIGWATRQLVGLC